MESQATESKYAKKFAVRRAKDNGKDNPIPRPFHLDYIPNRGVKANTHEWKYNPLMAHEKAFFTRFTAPLKPLHFRKKDTQVKYDHQAMNYSGWNS